VEQQNYVCWNSKDVHHGLLKVTMQELVNRDRSATNSFADIAYDTELLHMKLWLQPHFLCCLLVISKTRELCSCRFCHYTERADFISQLKLSYTNKGLLSVLAWSICMKLQTYWWLKYTSKTMTHSECDISRTACGYVQRTDREVTHEWT
jgi:hypothetical protein